MVTKKSKVIMLPTEDKTSIAYNKSLNIISSDISDYAVRNNNHISYQHLYITSDEEIKEGDWFIANQGVHKCLKIDKKDTQYPYVTKNSKGDIINHSRHWNTKIIATTDTSLKLKRIEHLGNSETTYYINLPQPSQSFIEKYIEEYNKGGIIIDILVEYRDYYINEKDGSEIHYFGYEFDDAVEDGFIVPKKVKNLIVNRDNTINILPIKDSWNREEVENLLIKALNHEGYNTEFGRKKDNENWIKENLK